MHQSSRQQPRTKYSVCTMHRLAYWVHSVASLFLLDKSLINDNYYYINQIWNTHTHTHRVAQANQLNKKSFIKHISCLARDCLPQTAAICRSDKSTPKRSNPVYGSRRWCCNGLMFRTTQMAKILLSLGEYQLDHIHIWHNSSLANLQTRLTHCRQLNEWPCGRCNHKQTRRSGRMCARASSIYTQPTDDNYI